MRPTSTLIAVFGGAALVGAVAAGLDGTDLRYGAQIVALLALAACVIVAGRAAPRRMVVALAVFCVLLTVASLVDLAAVRAPWPEPAPRGPNGCPVESPAITDYWTMRLRYGQLAELLRCAALVCAALAVRVLPGTRRRSVLVAAPVAVAVTAGLFTVLSGPAEPGRLIATVPGLLTLGAAAVVIAVAATRTAGGLPARAALIAGAVLTLVPALPATERLAHLHRQLPEPEPGSVFRICAYMIVPDTAPPLTDVASAAAVAALSLAAPALLVWAALRLAGQHLAGDGSRTEAR
ncbi:hypothetical protein [Actinoplanes sp. NPDC049802]|uniref:hypothetical protein n=1 Tax=Actinoplanes sp. NPDC049802 TaxID=3154742 RepID=UPI0033CD4C9B